MSVLSQIKLDRLTPQQISSLEDYRQCWLSARNATNRADRPAAEQGIKNAYEAADLLPPEQIIWCESPIEIEHTRKSSWYELSPGPTVKAKIVDDVLARALEAVQRQMPYHLYVTVASKLAFQPGLLASANGVNQAVAQAVSDINWGLNDYVKAIKLRLRGNERSYSYPAFDSSKWAQHESKDVLGIFAFLRNELGFVGETQCLSGLWQIALSAGWIVPHERICWASERNNALSIDANGRLHGPNGPALQFPDGWSYYSWKGIPVPKWVIEQPEQITSRSIERERNSLVRRCMIDIMTAERYVASGAPRRAGSDAVGTLWRRQWTPTDAWAAVEVVNGTPEPGGMHKHYFLQVPADLRTPTEAVAWTYGISAERYAALTHRT
jgi:hypothetical protein